LTDQKLIAGIGNAYSDEILFEARLSPTKITSTLTPEEISRLPSGNSQGSDLGDKRNKNEIRGGFT